MATHKIEHETNKTIRNISPKAHENSVIMIFKISKKKLLKDRDLLSNIIILPNLLFPSIIEIIGNIY